MPYPVIIVSSFNTSTAGITLMNATPTNAIENRSYPKRYYNFNMVITQQFTYQDQSTLQLTDNSSTNKYMLIDRLGKPVVADELEPYAATRRCIPCLFDSVTNTIRVLACLAPTCKYISEWVNPPATSTTTTTTPETGA